MLGVAGEIDSELVRRKLRSNTMSYRKLTEARLIRIITRTAKSRGRVRLGIGDDAAVLKDGTIVTTDAYAAGVHFDLSYMTLRQVGARCACGAISDVVAMAAEPEAVFVSLGLPHRVRRPEHRSWHRARELSVEQQVRRLYAGIDSVCAEMGCEVAGGDIIVTDQLLLALTVTGKTQTPKLRSGARAGDTLCVTGHLGSAEAGRMILAGEVRKQNPECRALDDGLRSTAQGLRFSGSDWRLPLVSRHLRPVPRLEVMREFRPCMRGLIDTSDGLATDARHLSELSGVKIVLEADSLPIAPATRRFCLERGLDPLSFVLGAGEDYELLFTSRRPIAFDTKRVKVTPIGSVHRGSGLWVHQAGRILPVTATGYDHLSTRGDGKTGY
jgi:thiamine-monophosphate kinase